MRNRLIELLCGHYMNTMDEAREVADILLENGAIIPPCKVGDKVYLFIDWGYEIEIEEKEVGAISIQGTNDSSKELWEDFRGGLIGTFADIGKTVFLTREDAEKALQSKKMAKSTIEG